MRFLVQAHSDFNDCLLMEARMPKFSNRPHYNHMPHVDLAEIILLVVIVVSIALAVGFNWVSHALLS